MTAGYGHGFGGMGWFGGVFMVLFWVIVIVGVIVVVRHMTSGGMHSGAPGHAAPEPMTILRERYARGEISTEEFEERKKVLEAGGEGN